MCACMCVCVCVCVCGVCVCVCVVCCVCGVCVWCVCVCVCEVLAFLLGKQFLIFFNLFFKTTNKTLSVSISLGGGLEKASLKFIPEILFESIYRKVTAYSP